MPFKEVEGYQSIFNRFIPEESVETDVPFMEKVSAAFQTENTLGAMLARESTAPTMYTVNPDYNPYDDLTEEERLDENFVLDAVYAETPQELEGLRAQSAKERENRSKLTGVDGALVSMAAGVFDPVNLIPVGGVAYKTYRTGGSILRNGLVTASVAGSSTALQESILHSQQIERTYGESALNISAATLLGMGLGSAASAFSKAQMDRMIRETDEIMDLGQPPSGSVGAARVAQDIQVKGTAAERLMKAMPFDPLTRTLVGESQQAKRLLVDLVENPIDVEGYTGQAVESLAKVRRDTFLYRGISSHRGIYKDYKKSGGKLRPKEFNEQVSREMRNPGSVDDEFVSRSASSWRQLYDAQLADMVDAGLLPEGVNVKTAAEYLNRSWNKEKVAANLPKFLDTVSEWLRHESIKKGEIQSQAQTLLDEYKNRISATKKISSKIDTQKDLLERTEAELKAVRDAEKATIQRALVTKKQADKPKLRGKRSELSVAETRQRNRLNVLNDRASGARYEIQRLEDDLARQEQIISDSLKKLEDSIADWPGKLGNKVRQAVKSRNGKELKRANKALMKSASKIAKVDLDATDFDDLAMEIAGRIMSAPNDMLPYDYKIGSESASKSSGLKSPFKNRVFNIPDALVEEFLDNDIEKLAARYINQTASDIEIIRRFGGPDLDPQEVLNFTSQKKDIELEYTNLINNAKTKKESTSLKKRKDRTLKDLNGMIDRIRGNYAIPDPNSQLDRFLLAAQNLNFLRLMGGVTISSIPDVGRVVMSEGFLKTFGTLFRPLIRGFQKSKLASEDVRYWGIGVDKVTGGRLDAIADINDYSLGGTKIERGLQAMANTFGNITLMNQWTSMMKATHAISMQTRIMDELSKGVYNPSLGRLGIDKTDALRIAEQVKKHGFKDENAWIYNAKNWDDQDLAWQWAAALKKESDRVILVPGQEKPLFMSTQAGKTILQFKSFMYSATQRILISGLQGQEAHMVQGMVAMITMGALAYVIKQAEAGRPISDDPKVWVMEGIDRSGALGLLMEINNTVEKVTANNFGLRPFVGASQAASRYSTRSATESVLGPTFGSLLDTTFRVASAATSEYEWTDGDTSAVRRMLPYQNLFILRTGLNEVEKVANEAID